MQRKQTAILLAGLMAASALAQEPTAPRLSGANAAEIQAPATDKNKLSYAIGMCVGDSIKEEKTEINLEALAAAIRDTLSGGPTRLTEKEVTEVAQQIEARHKKAASKKKTALKKKAGLDQNKTDTNSPSPAQIPNAAAIQPIPIDRDKLSYAIGMRVARNIKLNKMDVDVATLAKAVQDSLDGAPMQLTGKEASEAMQTWEKAQRAKFATTAEENEKAGAAFMARKIKEPGVKSFPSGLAFKIINEGSGVIPKSADLVKVRYHGTLVDGTEFISPYGFTQPFITPVNRVIPGWTEALLQMKAGSKWEIYVPSKLAFGDQGLYPHIAPKSTLVWEIELLSVTTPKANEIILPSASKPSARIETNRAGQPVGVAPKK